MTNQTLICPSMEALDRIWILHHHHYPLDFMTSSKVFCGIQLRAILQEVLMNLIYEVWEITLLKLHVLHDVQFSCAINQPLLAHHWRVHQCLLTSRFIAPSIPWGVSAPGGKMLKQLLKDHNFLNNSLIFIIGRSTFNIFAFQKALHTIHFNLKSCFGFGER